MNTRYGTYQPATGIACTLSSFLDLPCQSHPEHLRTVYQQLVSRQFCVAIRHFALEGWWVRSLTSSPSSRLDFWVAVLLPLGSLPALSIPRIFLSQSRFWQAAFHVHWHSHSTDSKNLMVQSSTVQALWDGPKLLRLVKFRMVWSWRRSFSSELALRFCQPEKLLGFWFRTSSRTAELLPCLCTWVLFHQGRDH